MTHRFGNLLGSLLFFSAAGIQSGMAAPACTVINTPADFDKIRHKLDADYCLGGDIDMSGVANFQPIGQVSEAFTGSFNGRGHVIRNLTIQIPQYGVSDVGLFGRVHEGQISNIGLINVNVHTERGCCGIGALVGIMRNSTVRNSYATGSVSGIWDVGGLIGASYHYVGGGLTGGGLVTESWTNVSVEGRDHVGGLVGWGGPVSYSYALGPVTAAGDAEFPNDAGVGGLVGTACLPDDPNVLGSPCGISNSFATGAVFSGASGGPNQRAVGGLVGRSFVVTRSFALGTVKGGSGNVVGGLVGVTQRNNISFAYSAGRVTAAPGDPSGGLLARHAYLGGPAVNSYWDTETSGQTTSDGGVGQTTAELQATIHRGFWGTRGVSYPFEVADQLKFWAPLAVTRVASDLEIFLPISQLEPSEYAAVVTHPGQASEAAVFTSVGRAVGVAKNVAVLRDEKIDTYFWNDATAQSRWQGPVTAHAALGPFVSLPAATPIGETNIIGALRTGRVVEIRGTYNNGTAKVTHWMLATSFFVNGPGKVTHLMANDPWTGRQVRISPTTKAVLHPVPFPLPGFTVDGYRVITLH